LVHIVLEIPYVVG